MGKLLTITQPNFELGKAGHDLYWKVAAFMEECLIKLSYVSIYRVFIGFFVVPFWITFHSFVLCYI